MRRLLGSGELLDLPAFRRRRVCRDMQTYADAIAEHFASALQGTMHGAGQGGGLAGVTECLRRQLERAPALQQRFFGHAARVLALYLPDRQRIYLNPDAFVRDPARGIDLFEHELCHHLLPGVDANNPADNLWFEGFNEAVSEWLADHLHRLADLPDRLSSRSVAYPVQSAFASLLLAADRRAAIAFMTNQATVDDVAALLRQQTELPSGLRPRLADALEQALWVTPGEREDIEALLRAWGWKGQDDQPPSIQRLLHPDGTFSAEALAAEFRQNRPFYTDTVDALTVVSLRQFRAESAGLPRLLADGALPRALADNLRRVDRYLRDPAQPLRGL
jgi:hypothetical protein